MSQIILVYEMGNVDQVDDFFFKFYSSPCLLGFQDGLKWVWLGPKYWGLNQGWSAESNFWKLG